MSLIRFDSPPAKTEWTTRLDEAWALRQLGHDDWAEGTIKLSIVLLEIRERFPSNKIFAAHLEMEGYGEHRISRKDRNAMVLMAQYPAISWPILRRTESYSEQLIWRDEIRPHTDRYRQPRQPPAPRKRNKDWFDRQKELQAERIKIRKQERARAEQRFTRLMFQKMEQYQINAEEDELLRYCILPLHVTYTSQEQLEDLIVKHEAAIKVYDRVRLHWLKRDPIT
jgi:hypothetical protein